MPSVVTIAAMSKQSEQIHSDNALVLAATWGARLEQAATSPVNALLPSGKTALSIEALAECAADAIKAGKTLMIVVPDDEWLPELSNSLDLALRPLCLVLPAAGFAAGIALRATLSLLKSNLSRNVDNAGTPHDVAWEAQRGRLECHADLWRMALEWSAAGRNSGIWPEQIGEIFPVIILPDTQVVTLAGEPRDRLLLVQPDRMASALQQLLERGKRTLLLRDASASAARELVPFDEDRRLKTELEMLAQEVGEMELEFATVQAELAEFTRRYHDRVGNRIAELDALQAQIAQQLASRNPVDIAIHQQAEQAREQAERSQREQTRFAELDREAEKPFAPSGKLKRLFRQLAQKIHPDRAENEEDRAWRTDLMSEANRAYRAGDEMVLHEILHQWQGGARKGRADQAERPGTTSAPRESVPSSLTLQIARLQRRLADINEQLDRLLASRLYELFAAANLARSRNRDLLEEMAGQLDGQIAEAKRRLEALT